MGGESGGEWIHVCVWLSPIAFHLEQSQRCQLAIPQYKIKSEKKRVFQLTIIAPVQHKLLAASTSRPVNEERGWGSAPVCWCQRVPRQAAVAAAAFFSLESGLEGFRLPPVLPEPPSAGSSHGHSRGMRRPSEKFTSRLWALPSSATDEGKSHSRVQHEGPERHQATVRPWQGKGGESEPVFQSTSEKEKGER